MPSYQEIMKLTGFRSKNAVFKLINRLVDAGMIEKDSQGRIVPKRIFGETKVLGIVEAGFPSPAEEELLDTMSLDEYLISNKEATFILQVSGNSMIDDLINDGDIVILRNDTTVNNGDTVAAWIKDKRATTLKRIFQLPGSSTIRLQPANPSMQPFEEPADNVEVQGKVICVIRRLG